MSNTSTASVSFHIAQNLGLNEAEYDKILSILNREPNFTELSIFSVMWSEHCSYKNSIKWLKTLPREGKGMLAKAGEENAGLVDIGDGLACAFKIESHNHPSAIEPYQGAATGVGGIHRDIFTMGARPIAALNSLRFGDLADAKTRHIVKGVVKGIGDYGNSFGVPTVAGEVYFDASYTVNPLVNAMSVGIVKQGETISATADGVGNPVYIVGSATGKDGIHGATFASGDLNEDSANDLPSVQVGDPFQEKLLLEATLEVITTGAVVGMQDMGAAGITCSTSEMSAKTGVGMDIDLDKVPTRQANMKPYEILLSESQERMLIVVQKGREAEVESVFEKWDLHCAVIGVITAGGQLRYFQNDELVAEVPAEPLVLGGGAPVYEREFTRPAYLNSVIDCNRNIDLTNEEIYDLGLNIVALPNIASKRWIYEQYDSMVQTGNVSTNKPSDAGVIVIKETGKGIAMTVDCNPYFVHANPYIGAQIAVAEAARNLVCSGAKPLAITNNLNFGNPYNPEVYYQFVEAVKGMGEACRTYDTPVTGGNVSFYNQSQEGPVLPTPTIGMIGLLENLDNHTSLKIQNQNDSVLILGGLSKDINSSQYLIQIQNIKVSKEPEFDLHKELRLQQLVLSLIDQKLISSAHDISEGGLFACLFEKLNLTKYGIKVDLPVQNLASILFGEAQGRVVVSCKAESVQMIDKLCVQYDIQLDNIGATNVSDVLQINDIVWSDKELATRYNSLFEIMNI